MRTPACLKLRLFISLIAAMFLLSGCAILMPPPKIEPLENIDPDIQEYVTDKMILPIPNFPTNELWELVGKTFYGPDYIITYQKTISAGELILLANLGDAYPPGKKIIQYNYRGYKFFYIGAPKKRLKKIAAAILMLETLS